jgi:hypothetical protein
MVGDTQASPVPAAVEGAESLLEHTIAMLRSVGAEARVPELFPNGITGINIEIGLAHPAGTGFHVSLQISGPPNKAPTAAETALLRAHSVLPKYSFHVSRHTSVSLSDSHVDQILSEGMNVLATVDGPDDVSCLIMLERDGSVSSFNVGDGTINSQDDYAAVCSIPGRIHVVNQINYCGGLISSNIIGCSDTPGGCMIVARLDDLDLEAVCWIHEFGHNCGLQHRNPDNITAVMNRQIDPAESRRVNDAECAAYSAGPPLASRLGAALPTHHAGPPRMRNMPLRSFLRRTFVHGVPYNVVRCTLIAMSHTLNCFRFSMTH